MSAASNSPMDDSAVFLPAGYEDWKKSSVSPVLLTTLAELARTAAQGVSTQKLLSDLAQLTMMATTADGAGTMSCAETTGDTVTFVHADSPRTTTVDRLQGELQQGPCHTSVQTLRPVAVRDFADATATRQWPQLAAAALEVGLRSTLAVPLLARGRAWGVLDVYREQPHGWTFADLLISKTLADVVASLLVLADDLERARAATRPKPAMPPRPAATTENQPFATNNSVGNLSADPLRAALDARLARLNSRLNANRKRFPAQPASPER